MIPETPDVFYNETNILVNKTVDQSLTIRRKYKSQSRIEKFFLKEIIRSGPFEIVKEYQNRE